MVPACPKCKKPLGGACLCCADVRFMWRCRKCFKLTTAFALPFEACPACGGELQILPTGGAADSLRMRAVRQAVQWELDLFHFYKLARDQTRHWEQRAVLDGLYDAELHILHTLDQQCHVHLEARAIELPLEEQNRLAQRLFRGICLSEHSGIRDLYGAALARETQVREQLRHLAQQLAPGGEQELCAELAAEDDEHRAVLESELALMNPVPV